MSNELIQFELSTPLEASWERCGGYLSDDGQSVVVVRDVYHSEQWVVVWILRVVIWFLHS
jgi:hypothetical protein